MKIDNLTILIDERVDHLDEYTLRLMYCAVEIPGETDVLVLSNEIKEAFNNSDGYEDLKKVHFTSLNLKQRRFLLQIISKLNITAKMYISYHFRTEPHKELARRLEVVVRETQIKHRNKRLTFIVENAEAYKRLIKTENLTSNDYLTIIADAMCFVFATKLNPIIPNKAAINAYNDRQYQLIRHQIRLHTYMFAEQKYEDTRDSRL